MEEHYENFMDIIKIPVFLHLVNRNNVEPFYLISSQY